MSTSTLPLPASTPPKSPSHLPDPEVLAKPVRRQFSARYKLEILEKADRCRVPGEVGALLRREGLYSSHLSAWRKARRQGILGAMKKRRGPKPDPDKAQMRRIQRLERENARLEEALRKARTIIEVQKKVSSLLGEDLPKLPNDANG